MTILQKLGCLALMNTTAIYADTIGGEVSLGIYSHAPSGYASYETTASVDLEDDLKWDTEQDIMLKAYIEHPFPFFPNVKFGFTKLSHEGQGTINTFSWGDIIDIDGDLDSSLDMKMYDVTAYYELLDNFIEMDTGITLRYMDGNIDVTVTPPFPLSTEHEVVNFTTLIPLVYGKVKVKIPQTDVRLQFEGNFISDGDTTLYDYEISTRYTFAMGLGIEAGYKVLHLDSQDLEDGLNTDMDFKGPYASMVWDF